MKCIKFLSLIIFIFSSISCTQSDSNINRLLSSYQNANPLAVESAMFLKNNMDDLNSEEVLFFKGSKGIRINFDTISSEFKLKKTIKENGLLYKSLSKPDTSLISFNQLKFDIEKSVSDRNKYPWNQNITKDIFLNYLLPYKVSNEGIGKWREVLYNRYKDSIKAYVKMGINDPNKLYYKIFVKDVGSWFHYSENYFKLTENPSFEEMMCVKKADCYGGSAFGVYVLRSLGIPAAQDFVPMWGSRNGSHATEVFMYPNGSMRTAKDREIKGAAKVFRKSFKKTFIWRDSISPLLSRGEKFRLNHLANNHWLDVTSEHCLTKDINYALSNCVNQKIAYICVFNYGEWFPVYFGKISKGQKTAHFRNMGVNILYWIAVPDGVSLKSLDAPFLLDSLGHKKDIVPNQNDRIELKLSKINSGTKAWVRKGNEYTLIYFNHLTNNWITVGTKTCLNDSLIIYKNVPSNGMYRLLETDKKIPVDRIFLYNNRKQIWY